MGPISVLMSGKGSNSGIFFKKMIFILLEMGFLFSLFFLVKFTLVMTHKHRLFHLLPVYLQNKAFVKNSHL